MADYLSNLVAKNIFPQESIRPRPLSLYEPIPGQERLVPMHASRLYEQEPYPTDLPVPEIGSSTFQAYRGRLDPPPHTPRKHAAKAVREGEHLSPPGEAKPVSPAPPSPEEAPSVHSETAGETPLRLKQEGVRLPLPAHSPPPDPSARQIREFMVKPTPISVPAVVPYLHTDLHPLPDLAARNSPPEPTPTVHVTIGRIEVRATHPPDPPRRKPAPRPTVMSLDEYLQSRTNGERR
jgi:hypothetical protein